LFTVFEKNIINRYNIIRGEIRINKEKIMSDSVEQLYLTTPTYPNFIEEDQAAESNQLKDSNLSSYNLLLELEGRIAQGNSTIQIAQAFHQVNESYTSSNKT
jgi:hypothetical protein